MEDANSSVRTSSTVKDDSIIFHDLLTNECIIYDYLLSSDSCKKLGCGSDEFRKWMDIKLLSKY